MPHLLSKQWEDVKGDAKWDFFKGVVQLMLPFLAGLGADKWFAGHSTALLWTVAFCVAVAVAFLGPVRTQKDDGTTNVQRSMLVMIITLGVTTIGLVVWALYVAPDAISPSPHITADNVEGQIVKWLDNFQLGVQSTPHEGYYFLRQVTLKNQNTVFVGRAKQRERYVAVHGVLRPNQEELAMYKKLTRDQFLETMKAIRLECARAQVNFLIEGRIPDVTINLEKRLPITDALTEDVLIAAIDGMDSMTTIVRLVVTDELKRFGVLTEKK